MSLPKGHTNDKNQSQLLNSVTNMPEDVAYGLLSFLHEFKGYLSGSAGMAMYMAKRRQPLPNIDGSPMRVGDLDLYIPATDIPLDPLVKDINDLIRGLNMALPQELENLFGSSSFRVDRNKHDITTELAKYDKDYSQNNWIYILNKFKMFFCDYLGLYVMEPKIKYNYYESTETSHTKLPWTRIIDFKPKIRTEAQVQDNHARRFAELRDQRMTENNHRRWDGFVDLPDIVAEDVVHSPAFTLPEIQIIFVKPDLDIVDYINKNFDFEIVKVVTTDDPSGENPVQVIGSEELSSETIKTGVRPAGFSYYIDNKLLNLPYNWESVTLVACFKTLLNRYLKYTERGFVPENIKVTPNIGIIKCYKTFHKGLKIYLYQKILRVYFSLNKKNKHLNRLVVSTSLKEIRKFIDSYRFKVREDSFYDNIKITLADNYGPTTHSDDRELLQTFTDDIKNDLKTVFETFILGLRTLTVDTYEMLGNSEYFTLGSSKPIIIAYLESEVARAKKYDKSAKNLTEQVAMSKVTKTGNVLPADVVKNLKEYTPETFTIENTATGGKRKTKKISKKKGGVGLFSKRTYKNTKESESKRN
tara:strand:+ start:9997 stop:11754 length:1758 start_codon:yes stop_codon:yes gene_type:complete